MALSRSPSAAFHPAAWRGERVFATWFSIAYGTFLAALPVDVFIDRVNYLSYASDSLGVLQTFWELGPVATLANEPLWLLLNHVLSLALTPPEVVRAIVFGSATAVSWLALTRARCHPAWMVLLLFLPQVVKNHIVHLRQGVAVAVFLAGWFSARRSVKLACFAASPLIHASYFFVLLLLGLAWGFDRLRLQAVTRVLAGGGACLTIAAAAFTLAELTGARQAEEYDFVAKDISGLGFVLWSGVLLLMLDEGRRFIVRHSFALLTLALYLSLYFVAEFSARIFESAMLVVLVAATQMTAWRRSALQSSIVFLLVYQYLTQMGSPWLGFGY